MAKEDPKITKSTYSNEVLTRGKMDPIVADIKDFIRTTVKGTENVLRNEIVSVEGRLGKRITIVEAKVEATQHCIVKMEKRLDEKIDLTRAELKQTEKRLDAKINSVESNLSEKIDKIGERLDSHEIRITTIETARL